jgi:hypothetical protein
LVLGYECDKIKQYLHNTCSQLPLIRRKQQGSQTSAASHLYMQMFAA